MIPRSIARRPAVSRAEPQSDVRKYIGVSIRSRAETGGESSPAITKTIATTIMLRMIRVEPRPKYQLVRISRGTRRSRSMARTHEVTATKWESA